MSELTHEQKAMILIGSLTLENADLQAKLMEAANKMNANSENNRLLRDEVEKLRHKITMMEAEVKKIQHVSRTGSGGSVDIPGLNSIGERV